MHRPAIGSRLRAVPETDAPALCVGLLGGQGRRPRSKRRHSRGARAAKRDLAGPETPSPRPTRRGTRRSRPRRALQAPPPRPQRGSRVPGLSGDWRCPPQTAVRARSSAGRDARCVELPSIGLRAIAPVVRASARESCDWALRRLRRHLVLERTVQVFASGDGPEDCRSRLPSRASPPRAASWNGGGGTGFRPALPRRRAPAQCQRRERRHPRRTKSTRRRQGSHPVRTTSQRRRSDSQQHLQQLSCWSLLSFDRPTFAHDPVTPGNADCIGWRHGPYN